MALHVHAKPELSPTVEMSSTVSVIGSREIVLLYKVSMGKLKIEVVSSLPQRKRNIKALKLDPVQPAVLCDGPYWPPVETLDRYDVFIAMLDVSSPCVRSREVFHSLAFSLARKGVKGSFGLHRAIGQKTSLWVKLFTALRSLGAVVRCTGLLRHRAGNLVLVLTSPSSASIESHLRFSKKLAWYRQFVEGLMAANYYFATLGGASYLIGGRWAPAAMWLARNQLAIARALGDRQLESQCCIHLAFNDMVLRCFRRAFKRLWRELRWSKSRGKERWTYIVRVSIYNLGQEMKMANKEADGRRTWSLPVAWQRGFEREMDALEACLEGTNVTVHDMAAMGSSYATLMNHI